MTSSRTCLPSSSVDEEDNKHRGCYFSNLVRRTKSYVLHRLPIFVEQLWGRCRTATTMTYARAYNSFVLVNEIIGTKPYKNTDECEESEAV